MFIIAEKINIMSKTIGAAIMNREAKIIQDLAVAQVEGGAQALDLNLGPATKNGPEMMQWLVEVVQEALPNVRLCLDTKNMEAMRAGLKLCKNRPIINSTNADREQLDIVLPMAKEFDADFIALTMTSAGIPRDMNERLENAAIIMATMMEYDIPFERVLLDPLVLPVGVAQQQAMEVIESIKAFQQLNDPPLKSVVGLSNVYNGVPKELRSRFAIVYVSMLAAVGLTAAIADSLDTELMATVKTIEVLKNEILYAASYLENILVKN